MIAIFQPREEAKVEEDMVLYIIGDMMKQRRVLLNSTTLTAAGVEFKFPWQGFKNEALNTKCLIQHVQDQKLSLIHI